MNTKEQFIIEFKKLRNHEDELPVQNIAGVRALLMSADTEFKAAFEQTSDGAERISLLGEYIFEHSPEIKEGIQAQKALAQATIEMFNALSDEDAIEVQEWLDEEGERIDAQRNLQLVKRLEKGYADAERLCIADFNNIQALEDIVSPELVEHIIGQCGIQLYSEDAE